MKKFTDWLKQKLEENIWGNIPAKGRKPSDGCCPMPPGQAMGGAMPPKMMKKMKKKMKK